MEQLVWTGSIPTNANAGMAIMVIIANLKRIRAQVTHAWMVDDAIFKEPTALSANVWVDLKGLHARQI